jgi:hypothetical protein
MPYKACATYINMFICWFKAKHLGKEVELSIKRRLDVLGLAEPMLLT